MNSASKNLPGNGRMKSGDDSFLKFFLVFRLYNLQKLIVLGLPQLQEYEGTLRLVAAVLACLCFIKFHGLRPEL